MINIYEGEELNVENILYFRGKINQEEMDYICLDMEEKVKAFGCKKIGVPITVTYGVVDGIADVEINVPIDKAVDDFDNYRFKKNLIVKNALKFEYIGEIGQMPKASAVLNDYISQKKLNVITPSFNIVEIKQGETVEIKLTVYIGVGADI